MPSPKQGYFEELESRVKRGLEIVEDLRKLNATAVEKAEITQALRRGRHYSTPFAQWSNYADESEKYQRELRLGIVSLDKACSDLFGSEDHSQ